MRCSCGLSAPGAGPWSGPRAMHAHSAGRACTLSMLYGILPHAVRCRLVNLLLAVAMLAQVSPLRACMVEDLLFGASCHDHDEYASADADGSPCPPHSDDAPDSPLCMCKSEKSFLGERSAKILIAPVAPISSLPLTMLVRTVFPPLPTQPSLSAAANALRLPLLN